MLEKEKKKNPDLKAAPCQDFVITLKLIKAKYLLKYKIAELICSAFPICHSLSAHLPVTKHLFPRKKACYRHQYCQGSFTLSKEKI